MVHSIVNNYKIAKLLKIIDLVSSILTRPLILMKTATSFEIVNLSPQIEGNSADKINVDRLAVDDKTVYDPVSESEMANWYV